MRKISYAEAIREAMREEMRRDDRVFLMGEDVGIYGGAQKVSLGLYQEFGPDRVIDTPLSEAAIVGAALGAALMGMRPIAEIMYMDFLPIAMEQILNHVAKIRFMSGGKLNCPMVIRTQYSLGRVHGPQHSQFFPSWLMNIPGLMVAVPSTPYDAKGLLKTAIRGEGPSVFIESASLYHGLRGDVPEEEYSIPFGSAEVKREGRDATVVAISRAVHEALSAAGELEGEGLDVEVIDPRTICPLDRETIIRSVKKTGKLVIASDDHKTGGIGAEISAIVSEEAFGHLHAPIARVCSPDIPIPFSPELEREYMVDKDDIKRAISRLMG